MDMTTTPDPATTGPAETDPGEKDFYAALCEIIGAATSTDPESTLTPNQVVEVLLALDIDRDEIREVYDPPELTI